MKSLPQDQRPVRPSSEFYPSFWSRRFRHIALLALTGKPLSGLAGLYWFVTGRRVRGWGRLVVAASFARQAYRRWIAGSEPKAFERYRNSGPAAGEVRLCMFLLSHGQDEQAAARSVASARTAFGSGVPVFSSVSEVLACNDGSRWVLPLLAGDLLRPDAGEIIATAIGERSDLVLIYWDEDAIERGERTDPWVKPDWNPTLFERTGGLAGACLISIDALRRLEPRPVEPDSRAEMEKVALQIGRSAATQIVHVPLMLSHRSSATRLPASLTVTASSLRAAESARPSVTLIIPTRDRPDLIGPCLAGVARTRYAGKLEVIIVDNGTVDPAALAIIAEHERQGATVLRDSGPFNFSRLNNEAAAAANCDFLCFYNNDVEPLDPLWLEHMMDHAANEQVGAVGALLLYPSGRIQHAGVAVGMGGAAGHIQKGVSPDALEFRSWHAVTREVSAVTAAVMVVRKRHFQAVGCFDESAFPVAFNDVDLCLRLREAGLRNVFVAEARLLHRESESRGDDRRPERRAKFAAELTALQKRWGTEDFNDPHFSSAFLRSSERCVLVP